ncbi:hypothetical protein KAW38_01900 [Candidatus Micrarchaeota archaeon]|nr:hypothetical protein [Candidatus Micrarchaeota archaeon]
MGDIRFKRRTGNLEEKLGKRVPVPKRTQSQQIDLIYKKAEHFVEENKRYDGLMNKEADLFACTLVLEMIQQEKAVKEQKISFLEIEKPSALISRSRRATKLEEEIKNVKAEIGKIEEEIGKKHMEIDSAYEHHLAVLEKTSGIPNKDIEPLFGIAVSAEVTDKALKNPSKVSIAKKAGRFWGRITGSDRIKEAEKVARGMLRSHEARALMGETFFSRQVFTKLGLNPAGKFKIKNLGALNEYIVNVKKGYPTAEYEMLANAVGEEVKEAQTKFYMKELGLKEPGFIKKKALKAKNLGLILLKKIIGEKIEGKQGSLVSKEFWEYTQKNEKEFIENLKKLINLEEEFTPKFSDLMKKRWGIFPKEYVKLKKGVGIGIGELIAELESLNELESHFGLDMEDFLKKHPFKNFEKELEKIRTLLASGEPLGKALSEAFKETKLFSRRKFSMLFKRRFGIDIKRLTSSEKLSYFSDKRVLSLLEAGKTETLGQIIEKAIRKESVNEANRLVKLYSEIVGKDTAKVVERDGKLLLQKSEKLTELSNEQIAKKIFGDFKNVSKYVSNDMLAERAVELKERIGLLEAELKKMEGKLKPSALKKLEEYIGRLKIYEQMIVLLKKGNNRGVILLALQAEGKTSKEALETVQVLFGPKGKFRHLGLNLKDKALSMVADFEEGLLGLQAETGKKLLKIGEKGGFVSPFSEKGTEAFSKVEILSSDIRVKIEQKWSSMLGERRISVFRRFGEKVTSFLRAKPILSKEVLNMFLEEIREVPGKAVSSREKLRMLRSREYMKKISSPIWKVVRPAMSDAALVRTALESGMYKQRFPRISGVGVLFRTTMTGTTILYTKRAFFFTANTIAYPFVEIGRDLGNIKTYVLEKGKELYMDKAHGWNQFLKRGRGGLGKKARATGWALWEGAFGFGRAGKDLARGVLRRWKPLAVLTVLTVTPYYIYKEYSSPEGTLQKFFGKEEAPTRIVKKGGEKKSVVHPRSKESLAKFRGVEFGVKKSIGEDLYNKYRKGIRKRASEAVKKKEDTTKVIKELKELISLTESTVAMLKKTELGMISYGEGGLEEDVFDALIDGSSSEEIVNIFKE